MSAAPATKRQNGQYFTTRSPFAHPEFHRWAARAGLPAETLIEPFAGENTITRMLEAEGLCRTFAAYDIEPASDDVAQRDVFADYPTDTGVAVTNPPYIARNSAKRRGLPYPDTEFPDLYLHALDVMLAHHRYVAAIIPAAFGTRRDFRDRVAHIIALPFTDMFGDTEHPVCLSLFEPETEGTKFWSWTTELGFETAIHATIPQLSKPARVVFNDPEGLLGLRAVDGTNGPSIRFCKGADIPASEIKHSSRSISRITAEGIHEENLEKIIEAANTQLDTIRNITQDVTLTPFKGVRKDGAFRRRLDFRSAKIIISLAIEKAS